MLLAGINVPDWLVLELTVLLRRADLADTADKLELAYDREAVVVGLTIDDRESVLRALEDDCSDGLAELRGVLLREHAWRVSEGLV